MGLGTYLRSMEYVRMGERCHIDDNADASVWIAVLVLSKWTHASIATQSLAVASWFVSTPAGMFV